MRLDVYLNRVCILKSRSLAKEACKRKKITINQRVARGSETVRSGDHIRLDLGVRVLELEVLEIPEAQISRKDSSRYYSILNDERIDLDSEMEF